MLWIGKVVSSMDIYAWDHWATITLCVAFHHQATIGTILVHDGLFWSILVYIMGDPHHPSMTGSDFYPLSSAHFIQKWVILVTQDKFETPLLCWPFGSILVHFGLFWCTSWVAPPPVHDCFWLLSPFKCPSNPEMDHISHWGHIQKKFSLSCYGDHLGPFWFILVHLMGDPTTPLHRISTKSSKICILRIKSF